MSARGVGAGAADDSISPTASLTSPTPATSAPASVDTRRFESPLRGRLPDRSGVVTSAPLPPSTDLPDLVVQQPLTRPWHDRVRKAIAPRPLACPIEAEIAGGVDVRKLAFLVRFQPG